MDELDWFVQRRIDAMFSGPARERAAQLLGKYEGDTPQERRSVHIAILKLSEKDLDRLGHFVDVALTDFRDVLYWAEGPLNEG